MFELDLQGKRAWVTGGSRGIGRAVVLALARAGCDVAVGYNSNAAEAEAVVEEVRNLGRLAVAIGGDLAHVQLTEDCYARIVAALGPVDILVNNAGVIRDNLFLLLDDNDWSAVIDSNLRSCVNATRAATRTMWKKKQGRIVNVSSVAATRGGAGQANYVATKGAIEAMTRSLAVEFAPRNITVNCVAPGVIDTEMSKPFVAAAGEGLLARQLVKRLGTPEEIAGWVVMLCSSYGDFVTGQILHVDGGLKMG